MRTEVAGTAVFCSIVIVLGSWMGSCSPKAIERYDEVGREPNLSPDYSGTVLPANIAPLNFRVMEDGRAYLLTVRSERGRPMSIFSKTGQIRIPVRQWHALLDANRGRDIFFDVYVRGADRQWGRFRPVANTIAQEDIDQTLVFRFMKPLYTWWKDIGIYQRNLTNYDVSVVLHGRSFGGGCLNCHSFVGNDPNTMTICLRSATYGSHTLLARNGAVDKIGAKWGYTAWHPSGTVAVYSINKVTQFFHAGGMEVRDVADLDSALVCYRVESHKGVVSQRNWPTKTGSKPIRHGLRTANTSTFAVRRSCGRIATPCRPRTMTSSSTIFGASRTMSRRTSGERPRPSFPPKRPARASCCQGYRPMDGSFSSACAVTGAFPVYQPSSDLYLMDLATKQYRKLSINSEFSESWHSWSSNSRWIAFSSKRQGGLFTRTYFSYVDDDGTVHKPFVLPQQDPTYYDSLLETYSVPELVKGPITANKSLLARAARAKPSITPEIPITGASPKAVPPDPQQERE